MNNKNWKILICLIIAFLTLIILQEVNVKIVQNKHEGNNSNIVITSGDGSGDIENDISSGDLSIISGDNSLPNSGDDNNIIEDPPVVVAPDLPHTYQIQTSNGTLYSNNLYLDSSDTYNQVEGITTFRGNNYRDSAFYGSLDVTEKKLSKIWTNTIGQTDNWTGVGWNGQPAIIKWNDETRKNMNLYDEFKQKENFIEVIYGALDSKVHFYDLETGAPTRDTIAVPSSIKGSVTIDPRGYPLLYVGQGINEVSGESVQMGYHIFSLITGEELLFINGRDKYAYLGWGAFDGNPIIDSKNDTLMLPGENGLIYIVKLNTTYDKENGTISINPDITRYRSTVNGKAGGIENALAVYKNYGYFMNNNGIVQCLDLNTLTPIWNFQMEDDCDATLGLEEENGTIMLYAACEVDRRKTTSPAVVRKINGLTGEVLWEYSCDCLYDASVNGGVLSSPVIGKNDISNLVIFNFSKVTSFYNGKMVALDKTNGTVIWEKDLVKYSWSSPVAIYSNSGKSYVIFGNSIGQLLLIDPLSGETLYTLNTGGGNIEGSPAIYDNKIIIGTRGKRIYCIEIK
ncbi:MAG: PQQ-like beta-propeller repeat protein [Clostridia bacterium]|nr:PQQ-like beta-propeller repeat protein [Clostridia bacterium]